MPDSTRKSRVASIVIRGVISLGLIAVIVYGLDTSDLSATLATVSVSTLLVLTAIDLLLRLLSAYRWHVLFRSTNNRSSLEETTRISFIASFLGQVLPGVIGVEALRVYGLARSSDDAAGAFASVVADRVFGLLSLVLVIMLGLLIGPSEVQSLILVPAVIALTILLVGVLAVMIPEARQILNRCMPGFLRDKVIHWIDDVYHCFDRYKSRPGLLSWSLLLALLFQFLRVTLFFVAALLIGESPSFVYFVVFVPIVMFAALLPVSIGGLGVREAGLVLLFSQFGVMESAPTFTVGILVFVSGLLSTLPGGWYYVRQRRQLKPVIDQAGS